MAVYIVYSGFGIGGARHGLNGAESSRGRS